MIGPGMGMPPQYRNMMAPNRGAPPVTGGPTPAPLGIPPMPGSMPPGMFGGMFPGGPGMSPGGLHSMIASRGLDPRLLTSTGAGTPQSFNPMIARLMGMSGGAMQPGGPGGPQPTPGLLGSPSDYAGPVTPYSPWSPGMGAGSAGTPRGMPWARPTNLGPRPTSKVKRRPAVKPKVPKPPKRRRGYGDRPPGSDRNSGRRPYGIDPDNPPWDTEYGGR